jgi:citrate synthase
LIRKRGGVSALVMQTGFRSGLEGVIVAETVLSEVNGEQGRLVIRGHPVEEIAGSRSFEAVVGSLWDGKDSFLAILAKRRSKRR